MDDLISRLDAIEALRARAYKVNTNTENGEYFWEGLVISKDIIEHIPSAQTADAVKVVRCKDCKWHRYDSYCENLSVIGFELDDFCSLGERKTDG